MLSWFECNGVVMPRFGPEPKFEPEPWRTWPKSGSKFKNWLNQTWNQVLQCNITWTIAKYGKGSVQICRTGLDFGFRSENLPEPDQRPSSRFKDFSQEPDQTGPRHHYNGGLFQKHKAQFDYIENDTRLTICSFHPKHLGTWATTTWSNQRVIHLFWISMDPFEWHGRWNWGSWLWMAGSTRKQLGTFNKKINRESFLGFVFVLILSFLLIPLFLLFLLPLCFFLHLYLHHLHP